jgi:hypothetical protein
MPRCRARDSAIWKNQVTGLVDTPWIFVHQNLGCRHAKIGPAIESCAQRGQPPGFGLRVVVQQRHKFTARGPDPLVVRSAKSEIFLVTNQASTKLVLRHVRGPVARSVVHHDHFECGSGLTPQ